MGQDLVRPAQVALDDGHLVGGRQQRPGVHDHHRVVVDVDDPGVRRGGLGDLVDVLLRGQPGPEVQELADAGVLGEEPHGPAEERPVGPRGARRGRVRRDHLFGGRLVGLEVVLAAEHVVVDARAVGNARVDLGWGRPLVHYLASSVAPLHHDVCDTILMRCRRSCALDKAWQIGASSNPPTSPRSCAPASASPPPAVRARWCWRSPFQLHLDASAIRYTLRGQLCTKGVWHAGWHSGTAGANQAVRRGRPARRGRDHHRPRPRHRTLGGTAARATGGSAHRGGSGDPAPPAKGRHRLDSGPKRRQRQRPDRAVIAYFDTSALIKLVIAEAGADQARLLWEQASEIVVSRLAWPEALAALGVFRACFARCTAVSVADHLVERAAELAADYDLRAADAIHLATALAAMDADSVFVSWDKRLQQAAIQAGLVTAPADS